MSTTQNKDAHAALKESMAIVRELASVAESIALAKEDCGLLPAAFTCVYLSQQHSKQRHTL
jgi:hypothetical protein